ncbi:MAG TPA: response regulator, partial [Vicinamibacterales bacterium]|nr:response regulator [Vicinamibacterales bacterium]
VLETLLEREGFSVLSTRSVGVGLQMLKAAVVDLVLIELPTQSRHEVEEIAEIRRQFPDVKIVVMSGFFGATPPPASRLRAHACIAKPIQPETLRQVMHWLLDQRSPQLLGVH